MPLVFSEEEMERLKELGITENNITEFNNRLRNAFPANFIASAATVPDENVSLNLHQEALDFIKKNSPYSFIDKYPEEKLEALEGISLLDKIGEDGIRKLEEYIQSRIDITEKCSPSGVAGAVVGLINGLHQKGVKIPHYPTWSISWTWLSRSKLEVRLNHQCLRMVKCTITVDLIQRD